MGEGIVVLHTTALTVGMLRPLFGERLPGRTVHDLLDEEILPAIAAGGGVTEPVIARFLSLVERARELRPAAVLCACSSIGGLADEAAETGEFPVFRIDRPMAESAVALGRKIGLLATFPGTVSPTSDLLRKTAGSRGVEIEVLLLEGAGALLKADRGQEFDELLARSALELAGRNDAVVLAQASMARALQHVAPGIRSRVLASPVSGVARLADFLAGCGGRTEDGV